MTQELNKNPQNEKLKAVYSFEHEVNRVTNIGWLSERDQKALEVFRNQISTLYKNTQAKGGLTRDAAEYYDT